MQYKEGVAADGFVLSDMRFVLFYPYRFEAYLYSPVLFCVYSLEQKSSYKRPKPGKTVYYGWTLYQKVAMAQFLVWLCKASLISYKVNSSLSWSENVPKRQWCLRSLRCCGQIYSVVTDMSAAESFSRWDAVKNNTGAGVSIYRNLLAIYWKRTLVFLYSGMVHIPFKIVPLHQTGS